jgi:large repetitive protein
MTTIGTNSVRVSYSWIVFLLFALAASLLTATPAWADACVADRGGVIDGYVNPVPPSQIQIDGNCTIRNFPASNPLTSNISFYTQPGKNPKRWLVIFDNVVHTGQMSCDAVQGHYIWFTNGSSSGIHESCQNLLIPVEKIDKANPAGQTTATIGVPFTYKLTIPVLFDPATGTVINYSGSVNDLHSIKITDDLNATGADLSYVSHTVYWLDDGTPVPHTFSNVGGVLTFDNFPIVPSGRQFVIDITVVLNDTPTNVVGTQFINTAKWEFGRLIDGTFYQPLPGEWGITPPLTIAAPQLVFTKSGPATMNLGQWGDFVLDVQNTGLTEAWDATIRDLLPDGPSGGMCDLTPAIQSAQVFAADGVTPVPGKGPLNLGSDYTLSYSAAPACRLDITMRTAAGTIGPNERLIIRYRTQLDSNTQNGIALTNIAGAIQWFNGNSGNPERVSYNRTLTDGTVGILDYQDAHTVTTLLTGYFFEKTVADLTSGANPAATATPGDTLRYTLRFRTTGQPLNDFRIYDEMDALNALPSFVPGSLTLVAYPAGADISATSGTGGSKGTGVLDIRNLNLPANSEAVVQFDIKLATTLTNATVVSNQATIRLSNGTVFAQSDDPNVNGTANPDVSGDEDPTRVTIVSTPAFVVQKISTDMTGDPNVLLAGETLRYTITVKNVGNANAVNVVLRDLVPANTTYVAGSTTLNGVAVPDSASQSQLVNGMLIHSPADPTPGSMPADASSSTNNVATITFEVVVNPNVVNGTVISNQGFVSAIDSGIVDYPSDDPATAIANDPTRDIVGSLPLLYAEKKVTLLVDLGSPGIVDPGDTLRYTITVQNSGAVPATGVTLRDSVPANTTYVANTTMLNGLAVGQPDGGVSPLAAGINISSSDLTPPLPGPGAGTISPGHTAVLQYDLQVNAGTPAGTMISNQAVVHSVERPDLLTDGDGNPATGPEPTVVVVGAVQQLSITKQVAVVGGGPAVPGAVLEYTVRVTNIAAVAAFNVVITDDLNASQPGQLTYVNGSATLNGSTAGVTFAGSTITADYAVVNGALAPGEVAVLRFRATLAPSLVDGTVVTNAGVVAWNNPTQTASASVSLIVGGIPGFAGLNGSAWHDSNFNNVRDSGEQPLTGWLVDLYRDTQLLNTVLTDANGNYHIIGVEPNDTTAVRYELRFRSPGAGANTASLGVADSPFTNGPQRISDIVVSSGANLQGLNLPIDPNGVIYNSIARAPIPGATLALRNAGTGVSLPTGCFDDAAQQGQVTLADGFYKFDVNFKDPACPSGGDYLIEVTAPPGTTYIAGYSQIIPPTSSASTAAFSVPACPGSTNDAILATAQYCEVQPSDSAPAASVAPRSAGTIYHVHVMLDGSQTPGSSQIFNNHIPLDPDVSGSVVLTKTTPQRNVTRGQLVPYTITLNNNAGLMITDVAIVDRMPAGFTYVKGSALLDSVPTEPTVDVAAGTLSWSGLTVAGTQVRTVKLLLLVGAGAGEGEYVNRAQASIAVTGAAISGEATARVRVTPDLTFDCTDVFGKVFNDANRNGRQDGGEDGLPGVRVVTARGLQATTDQYGRYHITCAITPNESHGSNFVLKLDDRSLPSGYRMSTDQLQVKHVTRGKAMKFDFGASIYRAVAIDLSDAVFEPGKTEIRAQWQPRLNVLLDELRKAPALLRLSYVADTEDEALVKRRVEAVKKQLTDSWDQGKPSYVLTIEPEVFWRLGAPPKRPDLRRPESR